MKEKIKEILKLGFISTLVCLGLVFLIAIISPDSSLPEEKLPASIHEVIEKEQPPSQSQKEKSEPSVTEPILESESESQLQTEPEPEPEPCANITCLSCKYCDSGICVNYCKGNDSSCGCSSCINCNSSDGWVIKGSSYSCCEGNKKCVCQNQEYRDYYCLGNSCTYLIINNKTNKTNCYECASNQYCSGGNCYSSNPSSEIICSYNFYNCSDFTTHSEAQSVFEFCGGINNDIHYLDGDNDGIACESLTSGSESPEPLPEPFPPSSSIICSYNAYNCSDFSTHSEAQSVFEYCGGVSKDIHRLDGDNDGVACESLP